MDWELVPVLIVETNPVILDATEQNRTNYTHRKLTQHFCKIICCHRIHLVVDLAKEHGSLVREYQDDVLDRAHRCLQTDEEQSTVPGLDTRRILSEIVE